MRTITEKWDDALASEDRRLPVADILRQLCLPPHGANIASAGLILGVFVAPRAEKLVAVRDGQQVAISQWIQDGFFKGKFIDLAALHGVDLISIGEASSEWETLLDEWEQADNHLARRTCLERAAELKNRVPVPPSLAYREVHLCDQARISIEAVAKMDVTQSAAIEKIEQGLERRDVSGLSWGAASLRDMHEKMTAEKPVWTDLQIAELQPPFERARQAVVMHFKEWLARQTPRGDTPDAVGDFKHRMVRLVGGNLKRIGLEELSVEVEARTAAVVRQAETIAETHQLLRDVTSWLTLHGDATRIVRVADLRALRDVGKEFASKLQGMSERISLAEIGATRTQLSAFLTKLKDAEADAVKRASGLWQSKLRSDEDFERLFAEVESLVSVFENLPSDQEDILLMRRALRLYQKDYQQLSSDRLTWPEFEKLAEQLRKDASSTFGEEDIPWSPEDAIGGFVASITKQRKDASATWIVARKHEMGDSLDGYMPILDMMGRKFPRAWLFMARLYMEQQSSGGYEKAKTILKKYLENDSKSHVAADAWRDLARCCYMTGDKLGDIHAFIQRCKIALVPFRDLANTAKLFGDLLRREELGLDAEAKKILGEELLAELEKRRSEASADELGKMAVLALRLGSYARASEFVRLGLKREPDNPFLKTLADRHKISL